MPFGQRDKSGFQFEEIWKVIPRNTFQSLLSPPLDTVQSSLGSSLDRDLGSVLVRLPKIKSCKKNQIQRFPQFYIFRVCLLKTFDNLQKRWRLLCQLLFQTGFHRCCSDAANATSTWERVLSGKIFGPGETHVYSLYPNPSSGAFFVHF